MSYFNDIRVMRKTIGTLFSLVAAVATHAQVGKFFPILEGSLLDGKAVSVPLNNGKKTVVGVVYSRDAEDVLKKWLQPLYETFVETDKGPMDMSESYDVNFVFVPMIKGMKLVREEFKKSTDQSYWKYILDTEKADIRISQKELLVTDTKIPYFYVVDKNGKVLEVQSGGFTEQKLEKLEEAVEK